MRLSCVALLVASLGLGGCAQFGGLFGTVGPDYTASAPPAAPAWIANQLPHDGSPRRLAAWWAQFDDPTLTALIDAAQSASPTLAQAAASVERARADSVAAGVAGQPGVEAIASANRAAITFGGPVLIRSQYQAGVQASWEIDLFGGLARQREAAQAHLAASDAAWHDARVAVAAETANAYVEFRFCEMQVALAVADGASRAETARLAAAASQAGFQAPATAALAHASAADAAAALTQQRAACRRAIKGLTALTALEEATVDRLLGEAARTARLPEPAAFQVAAVPARVLAQRPDIAAAERTLAATSAEIGIAEAQRYPRLTLAGSITPTRAQFGTAPAFSATTWSIGPSLTLPLVTGGRLTANIAAARARYIAAESDYRARARNAVREVEEALVRLEAAAARATDLAAAEKGYVTYLDATILRQRNGLANLTEVEDARRTALAARGASGLLQRERVAAWVALYRAVGGGWNTDKQP